ncbi:MAG: hypothetical protein ACK559_34200, partial [bacterium]
PTVSHALKAHPCRGPGPPREPAHEPAASPKMALVAFGSAPPCAPLRLGPAGRFAGSSLADGAHRC